MLKDVLLATNIAFIWLMLIALAFLMLGGKYQKRLQPWLPTTRVGGIFFVFSLAFFVRMIPAILLPVGAGYDIDSFRLVGQALMSQEEVYTSSARGRHPYLPFQMYLIGLSYLASLKLSIPFVVALKLPLVVVDSLIAVLIFVFLRREHVTVSLRSSLMYALNPVALLVTSYHGQFDSVALLFLLTSVYIWRFHRKIGLASIVLGFAILNKTWPVVYFPIMYLRLESWRHRILSTIVSFGVPIVGTVAYLVIFSAEVEPILSRSLTHTGNSGWWGLSAILALLAGVEPSAQILYDLIVANRRWPLLLGGLLGLWLTRKQKTVSALVTIILIQFAVTPGIGVQWMIWIVPLAIAEDPNDMFWTKLFGITGGLFLVVQNYGLHMYGWLDILFGTWGPDVMRLGSIPAWITVLLWLGIRLRQAGKVELHT